MGSRVIVPFVLFLTVDAKGQFALEHAPLSKSSLRNEVVPPVRCRVARCIQSQRTRPASPTKGTPFVSLGTRIERDWQHDRVVTCDYFVADAWNRRYYLIYREWVGSRDERV